MCFIFAPKINFSLFSFDNTFQFQFLQKRNENNEPILEFVYKDRLKPRMKRTTKFYLKEKLDSWYSLLPEKDFEVRVYNKRTKAYSAEKAKAIKLFLQFMRENNAVHGISDKYCTISKTFTDFITKNGLTHENNDIQQKYKTLFYCISTIAKILMPPFAYFARGSSMQTVKAFLHNSGFHFSFDLPQTVWEEHKQFDETPLIRFDDDTVCENFIPAYFSELGSQKEEYLKEHPEIYKIENYYLSND